MLFLQKSFRSSGVLFLLACGILGGWPASAVLLAQPRLIPEFPQAETRPGAKLQTERYGHEEWYRIDVESEFLQRFEATRHLLEQDRPLDAAMGIQNVLEYQADFLLPQTVEQLSSREFLHHWVEQLPTEALKAYEAQYGAKARFLVQTYRDQQNLAALHEAVQRYLHTTAGAEAAYLLGCHYLNRGEFLASASQLSRLAEIPRLSARYEPALTLQRAFCYRQLGQPEEAKRLLADYLTRTKQATFSLAGESLTLEQLLALWQSGGAEIPAVGERQFQAGSSSDWPLFRKSPDRLRQAGVFSSLPRTLWSVDVLQPLLSAALPRREVIERLVYSVLDLLKQDQFTVLPAWNPILVDDKILIAGFGTVVAFSRKTGQLEWKSQTADLGLEFLQNEDLIERYPVYPAGEIRELHQYLLQQLVGDMTTGTLSSDGERVYTIRGCGFADALRTSRLFVNHGTAPLVPTETNYLAALDVKTGQLLWEQGGLQRREPQILSGHYFLGPPLMVEGKLLVVSESGEEIFLSELDPQTGLPRWQQPLVHPQYSILLDSPRRLAGTSLVYSAPLLICQTNSGTTVAFDLHQREFRWIFRYGSPLEELPPFAGIRRPASRQAARDVNMLNGSRWQETVPVVIGHRILLTPGDSQDLICCDLATGQQLWVEPRRDGMYVEAVSAEKILVVGRHAIRCLRLTDGVPLWSTPLTPDVPSGRGLVKEGTYLLPTHQSGLLTFDTGTGQLLANTEVPTGELLGNLFVSRDQLFSFGGVHLTAFQPLADLQRDIEQELQSQSPSAALLVLQGQLALHSGDLKAGIGFFKQAYRQEQSPEIARQLTKTLLNADMNMLEFSVSEMEELAQLMVSADHSTDIVYRYALALLRLNKSAEAFDVFRKILVSPRHQHQLVGVSGVQRVRVAQLVAGQMKDLLAKTESPETAEIRQQCQELLEAQQSPAELQALMPLFAGEELEKQARMQFVRLSQTPPQNLTSEQNLATEQNLTTERHLFWLLKNSEETLQPEWQARLAVLYISRQKWEALQKPLELLKTRYADRLCLEGKTGAELAADWQSQIPAAALLPVSLERTSPAATSNNAPRPVDERFQISVNREIITGIRGDQPRTLPALHRHSQPWSNWNFEVLKSYGKITAFDAWHRPQWQTTFESGLPASGECHLFSEGHLFIVACEGELYGLDTLAANQAGAMNQKPVWQQKFGLSSGPQKPGFGFLEMDPTPVLGVTPLVLSWEREVGQLAGCFDHHLVYREESRLVVRDAASGGTLWDLELGTVEGKQIWADDQFVYVLDLQTTAEKSYGQLTRYRLIDGQPSRETELPPHQQLLAFQGSMAIFWQRLHSHEGQLYAYDLSTQKIFWLQKTSGTLSLTFADDEHLFCHDIGHQQMLILDSDRAEPVLSQFSVPENSAAQIFIAADSDHWYLHFTGKPQEPTSPLTFYSLQDIHGPVMAVSRRSYQPQWTRNLELLRWIPQQSTGLPFLVYGSLVSGHTDGSAGRVKLEILDKQTGQSLTKLPAGLEGRLIDIEMDSSSRQYRLNFSKGTLVIQELLPPTS